MYCAGDAMEVDGTDGGLLGPAQHAALRSGIFWLTRSSSQAQAGYQQSSVSTRQQQQKLPGKDKQPGASSEGGAAQEGAQKAKSSGAGGEGSGGGQEAEGSFMYGGGGGTVLLFEAGDPCPRAAWLLPR
jgi:hypothetical protein